MSGHLTDAAGTVRTWQSGGFLDAAGTVRTVAAMSIMDVSGTTREFFSNAASGGGATVSIAPESSTTRSATSRAFTRNFTVTYAGSIMPSAYSWGTDSPEGAIVSGGLTAIAGLRVTDYDGVGTFASFYCDVTINGVVSRAYCSMEHTYSGSGSKTGPSL